MPRPCLCDRCRPGPYTLDQCRLCWLAANDPRYQQRWGLPVTAKGAVTLLPAQPAPTASCVHLGPPTGAVAHCRSCQGHVQVKVCACAVHGQCTPARKVAGLPCCGTCPDYRGREEPPADGRRFGDQAPSPPAGANGNDRKVEAAP